MDRQIIVPRGRVRYSEWIMERRVLFACALGILCFVVGFLAAGPRLHAGNRLPKAPPGIVVESSPVVRPSATSTHTLAPDISVVPISGSPSSVTEGRNSANVSDSTDIPAERPPRKKKRVVLKPKVESAEPIVVYEPPKPGSDEAAEESFRREVVWDPAINP